jgi:hypothetical protein
MLNLRNPTRSVIRVLALASLLAFVPSADARRGKEPVFATSAEDPVLGARLAALGPGVDPEEARRVAFTAYTTGRDMAREWRVVWPPGLQNFLVNHGARKGGLCFQWATELLVRLDALNLRTLEFHWAESYPGSLSEHNVIVMTARGLPIEQGILLDNWRHLGRLIWGRVVDDPQYEWKENKAAMMSRLPRRTSKAAAGRRMPRDNAKAEKPTTRKRQSP